ncbi:hypothetical protein MJ257_09810 [Paenibacillus timonensis]|uniref:Uncharacterized protein n=1 Tax=Paenibacillus timonensis TaxID=225915 RepID=A0ABW3SB34_9BACL|nr:hypothetical protein [Paenibacillus timonensis]MCH1640400.1 hypothetical protein [Paenibacillus timonensis]
MSDFMKGIVQEALRGGAGGRRNPDRSIEPSRINLDLRTSAVPGISRPNYQLERKEQRLGAMSGGNERAAVTSTAPVLASAGSPVAVTVSAQASSPAFVSPSAPVPGTVKALASNSVSAAPLTRDFIEESLAPLLRMSLVQGNSREECGAGCTDTAATPDESSMLGRSCAGMDFWYYPDLRPELIGELGLRRNSAKSVGIIAEGRCRPGQLFLLSGCSAISGVDVDINWKREGDRDFQAVLTGEAPSEIRNVLLSMYEQCLRSGSRRIQSYIALEPSSILMKYLDIPRGDAVAALEGISRYRSIALLDRALKLGMSSRVKFSIADEYVILTGERGDLSEASTLFGKLIERYA